MSLVLESIKVSVDAAAVVLIIAATGAILTRKGVLTKEGTACITGVTIKCLLPCLMFSELMENLEVNDLGIFFLVIIICLLQIAIGCLYGYLASLLTRSKPHRKLAMAAVGFSNLPVVIVYAQVLGDSNSTPAHFKSKGIQYALFYYCVLSFCKWTIAYSMMKPSKGDRLFESLKSADSEPAELARDISEDEVEETFWWKVKQKQ